MSSFNKKKSSQLLTETSDDLRNKLSARNLYSIDNEYSPGGIEINKMLGGSLNNIISVIEPLQSVKLIVGDIGDRLVNPSPLLVIGMQQLVKQLGYTVASNSAANYLPKFNPLNLLQKGKPVFSLPLDYSITNRKRTAVGEVVKVLQTVTGFYDTKDPFTIDSTIKDYIENTSDGQLGALISHINRNFWVNDEYYINQFPKSSGSLVGDIIRNKKYISFGSKRLNSILSTEQLIKNSDTSIYNELSILFATTSEYNIDNEEFLESFGKTEAAKGLHDDNNPFNSDDYGINTNINTQFILGIDGKTKDATRFNDKFGVRDENNKLVGFNETNISSKYDIRQGLLKYTTELLNASEGRVLDITRKKYFNSTNSNEFVGYNGAGLFIPNEDSMFVGKDGIRQHTVIDQYNRYAKAIRFEGNKFYGGHKNSVIYNSVIPKIHPVFGNDYPNKNMMFSIENLAYDLKDNGDGTAVDSKDGDILTLPITELGQNKGRIMWFPPYDIKFNETSNVKWESNNFIGRGEPMYTYSNSERSGTLSFKLLVDHPPQVLNYRGDSKFHQRASEFFAFGGKGDVVNDNGLPELKAKLGDLKKQLDSVQAPIEFNSDPLVFSDYYYYFDNNVPYQNSNFDPTSTNYEYNVNYNLNNTFRTNFEKLFTLKQINNDNINNLIIDISGSATKLYDSTRTGIKEPDYNLKLSQYRCDSIKNYIINLCNENGITGNFSNIFKLDAQGSKLSSIDNGTISSIESKGAKEERSVKIVITDNSEPKTSDVSSEDKAKKEELLKEIDKTEKDIRDIEKQINNIKPYNFREIKINDKFFKGFQGTKENVYQPSFYSQTPEDYHRRLTFLHQCTKQGRPIVDQTNISSGKNSVFGRPPFCILRIGDFIFSKIIIEQITFNYEESDGMLWDQNPEGRGMQPMTANISMNIKIIGGQSMEGPISALQNALGFNYYANSTFTTSDTYKTAREAEKGEYGSGDTKTNN